MRTNWVTNEAPLGIQFEVEVRKESEGIWKTERKRRRRILGRVKRKMQKTKEIGKGGWRNEE
jgi:hypothetical protein